MNGRRQPASRRTPKPVQRGKKRYRGRIALGLLSLAGLGAFYVYFETYLRDTEHFQVRAVEIDGVNFLDEQTVYENSGITAEDNVFFFDPDATRTRVERLPYVKSCAVSVTFPDTVVLAIEERQPVASLFVHSRAYEIDVDGVVLREYPVGEPPRGPYISASPNVRFVIPGEAIKDDGVQAALNIWLVCRSVGVDKAVTISEFAVFGPQDIRMYCDEFRYEVRWGRGDPERQALRLLAFWSQLGLSAPCDEYLDLRFGRDLACK